MMENSKHFDVVVIGSGPAGQKAAVQAAKAGRLVALIESDKYLGGACVHRGTIPSKTLRANALRIGEVRHHAELFDFALRPDMQMATLVDTLGSVVKAHDDYITGQISRNSIHRLQGRAGFIDQYSLRLSQPGGHSQIIEFEDAIIATGSYPRHMDNIPVDHEYIFDSDSILSMLYLPRSLVVLGGGVIASEYASIFASLGVEVTMIDRYARPLGFLDSDLTDRFVHAFEEDGGKFIPNAMVETVYWDGVSEVVTKLEDGREFRSEKLLLAAGRVANVDHLRLNNIGLSLNDNGVISVDRYCRTELENIYAAGDVIGPPSLASASMEQGRRASCAALSLDMGEMSDLIPMGIYAIPELSSVGMTAAQAEKEYEDPIVGLARFEEIARGQIAGIQDGLLKLVADPEGKKLLGVQIVGEGATELIHIGQMALLADLPVDTFVENIFNFPTLAEAYRVAALHIVGQRQQRMRGR